MAMERRGLARTLKVWVNVIFILMAVGAVIMAVMWPISGFVEDAGFDLNIPVMIGESSFPTLHQLEVSAEALQEDRAGISRPVIVNARGELHLRGSMVGFSLIFWGLMVLALGAVILGLQFLRQILTTTAEGRPFHPDNVRRLNYLGWLITASGVVFPFAQFFMARWVLSRFQFTPVPLSPPLQVHQEWIFSGLLVLVLAAVWKEAVRMAEEESLTV